MNTNILFKSVIEVDGKKEEIVEKVKGFAEKGIIKYYSNVGKDDTVYNEITFEDDRITIKRLESEIILVKNEWTKNLYQTQYGVVELSTILKDYKKTATSLFFNYDLETPGVKQNFNISLEWGKENANKSKK